MPTLISCKFKLITFLILIIIPFSFLGYGIWSINKSKKESNITKSKALFGTGVTTLIISSSILFIELLILIVIIVLKIEYIIDQC